MEDEPDETLTLIDSIRTGVEDLLDRETVEGYAAEDYLDECLDSLDAAYNDVTRHEESQ